MLLARRLQFIRVSIGVLLVLPQLLARADQPWVDLGQLSRSAQKLHSPITEYRTIHSGGVPRLAIFQHAGNPKGPQAELRFREIALPKLAGGIERIVLRTAIGFKDGKGFTKEQKDGDFVDGVVFRVEVDDEEIFQKVHEKQHWVEEQIDLTAMAGKTVSLKFCVDARKSSAADWACWAEPTIWCLGDSTEPRRWQTQNRLPEFWPLEKLRQRALPNRVVKQIGGAWAGTLDEHLDLAVNLRRTAAETDPALVPLAPRLVVGQGHTLTITP